MAQPTVPMPAFPKDEDIEAAVDFKLSDDPWVTYELSDGTILKIKVDLLYAKRLKQRDPLGQPQYFIVVGPPLARVIKFSLRK